MKQTNQNKRFLFNILFIEIDFKKYSVDEFNIAKNYSRNLNQLLLCDQNPEPNFRLRIPKQLVDCGLCCTTCA